MWRFSHSGMSPSRVSQCTHQEGLPTLVNASNEPKSYYFPGTVLGSGYAERNPVDTFAFQELNVSSSTGTKGLTRAAERTLRKWKGQLSPWEWGQGKKEVSKEQVGGLSSWKPLAWWNLKMRIRQMRKGRRHSRKRQLRDSRGEESLEEVLAFVSSMPRRECD